MKAKNIYLNNFYNRSAALGIQDPETNEKRTNLIGLHGKVEDNVVKAHTISEILKALILYDELIINESDISIVINSFGVRDTLKLIQTDRIKIIEDLKHSVSIGNFEDRYYFTSLYLAKDENRESTLEELEKEIKAMKFNSTELNNLLLTNLESRISKVPIQKITNKIQDELSYDLQNKNVSQYLDLNSIDLDNLRKKDIYNVMRLGKLNKSLIVLHETNAGSVALDAAVKDILSYKLSPVLKQDVKTNIYKDFFKDIFDKKGIPDFTKLYIKGIINIEDILNFLNNFSAAKFRNWINDKNYNPVELEKDIINSNPKIGNKYQRFLLWTIPNLIGVILPTVKIPTSFAKSYIVDKILDGWHPNLYLDDVLKLSIDEKLKKHENSEKRRELKKKFPDIGRNDKCPCKSGKKFKKCCGVI